ncbi:hypothetical protein [Iningainema tapete]|uniref:Uncharacterized protein n=1 Tax=Iningainema tapete BLCC-T55 TaxID=2748662 RepID=A0A8J6XDL3_9CYAN|nr:hypothetical protein [Iningainema tapete]MBD2771145.1 hypothetical protein [Iningainema tapete BLCC-T55]
MIAKKLEKKVSGLHYVTGVCVVLLIGLSINSIQVWKEINSIQDGINTRTKSRYSALDAAKDKAILDKKLTDMERRLAVLEGN